jgi:thioredoxin reductase
VVVGSGPGGLQTSYWLGRYGVRHATISRDDSSAGMFRKWPIFQRLLSWSLLDAPAERTSRDYERYDHNSLIADEPELRALVPAMMSRAAVVPTRPEMEAGLAEFARRAPVEVRYGCEWTATRPEEDGLTLVTSDGEYRCRAAVFAVGVTSPWTSPGIPGVEHAVHYAACRHDPASYRDRRVVVIGKRNSGFELADGLLPWARQVMLLSPRPVRVTQLAQTTVRVRYLQPLEIHSVGGGVFALDAAVDQIERTADGYRVSARGTTHPGHVVIDADDVLAATGFTTPFGDLPQHGLKRVAQDRIPALGPWWEAAGVPNAFFAGNASQGAPGLRKHGLEANSAAVLGFRYNARLLAAHLAGRYGGTPPAPRAIPRDDAVHALVRSFTGSPELWTQKGYLAHVVSLHADRALDEGPQPLAHFVDAAGPEALAASIEIDPQGTIHPVVYHRVGATVHEHPLDPEPMLRFDGDAYDREVTGLLAAPH